MTRLADTLNPPPLPERSLMQDLPPITNRTAGNRARYVGLLIKVDGAPWRVTNTGALEDGRLFCHLSHAVEGQWHRNGWRPKQIADWLPVADLEATIAADMIDLRKRGKA